MVSKKVILYISVPGLALIYGIYLYRRRRGGDNLKKITNGGKSKQQLNIDNHIFETKKSSVCIVTKAASPETEFGRSAPISIYSENKIGKKPNLNTNMELISFTPSSAGLPGTPPIRKAVFKQNCETQIVKASSNFKIPNFDQQETTNEIFIIKRKREENQSNISPDSMYHSQSDSLSVSDNRNINYEFILPNRFIGKFYGKNKKNLNRIKSQTGTSITVKRHTFSDDLKVCVITGSQTEVYSALTLIRQILPKKKFPNLTLQRISFYSPDQIFQLPVENCLQLNLVEGINNDVVVTTVTVQQDLLTIFVQQPLHPSHPFLPVLQTYLNCTYNSIEAPLLPQTKENVICVGKVYHTWYRLQIIRSFSDYCFAKFVDYGGFVEINNEDIRQIRQDLLSIPFQAIDCYLSNLQPKKGDWSTEVPEAIMKLTQNIVLQAQVVGYREDNKPEIFLFANLGGKNIVFINKELVARNYAKWVD